MTIIDSDIVNNIFIPIPSKIHSLYHILSLTLGGNINNHIHIKRKVEKYIKKHKKETNEFNIFYSISKLYKCNVFVFNQLSEKEYKLFPIKNKKTSTFIYIRKGRRKDFYQALILQKKKRNQPQLLQNIHDIQFKQTKNKLHSFIDAKYHVEYTDNTTDIITWYQLKEIINVIDFIQNSFVSELQEDLLELITKNEKQIYGIHNGQKPRYKNFRRLTRKNYTGKKVTEMMKLDLKNKGGCYCFMPYETMDAKQNAIFKVGMTLNFDKRADQYHTYFPGGVYTVAFLANPILENWNKRKEHLKLTLVSQKTIFYKEIENFLFKYIILYKGKRIFSTTRVQRADSKKSGATEWFYCNEDIIHDAFNEAKKRYGGEIRHFYLEGIDSNNGEIVSINNIAKRKRIHLPSYSGEILFNL